MAETSADMLQGAQVSLDTLCGTTDGPNFNATQAQAPMLGNKSKPPCLKIACLSC